MSRLKENRFAIITILLKQIAVERREQWPHLHIKAHPMDWAANRARLVIRDGDTRVIFDLRQGPVVSWQNRQRDSRKDPNEYNVSVKITEGNDVSKKKTPEPWAFSLDAPDSVTNLEQFVDSVVKQWINVEPPEQPEAECPIDSNGPAEA